jgi:hypothetical protein
MLMRRLSHRSLFLAGGKSGHIVCCIVQFVSPFPTRPSMLFVPLYRQLAQAATALTPTPTFAAERLSAVSALVVPTSSAASQERPRSRLAPLEEAFVSIPKLRPVVALLLPVSVLGALSTSAAATADLTSHAAGEVARTHTVIPAVAPMLLVSALASLTFNVAKPVHQLAYPTLSVALARCQPMSALVPNVMEALAAMLAVTFRKELQRPLPMVK